MGSRIQTLLPAYKALFDWCLGNAEAALDRERIDEASIWCEVAARSSSGSGFWGFLASSELDEILLRIARHLPGRPGGKRATGPKQRCLHVFTEVYPIFGHTKLCRKWIELDSQARTHSIILLDQKSPVPENLVTTVTPGGGSILRLDRTLSLTKRAIRLRKAAYEQADVVILHTHPYDVIAPVAFGVPGGPPVIMVNHADHLFWAGRPVIDMLFDIRDSGHSWSTCLRQILRSTIVPIPLADDTTVPPLRQEGQQLQARQSLGLPPGACVLLTIGNWEKYRPFWGLDFCHTAKNILARDPNVFLLAVGPLNRGIWRKTSKTTGGRLRVLGPQRDLTKFHAAADVYLEGFPIGSLTALLEAALAGLPCVRAPKLCPPPFRSDGVALEGLAQPEDATNYERAVLDLISNLEVRTQVGETTRRAVIAHHCGEGWRQHLNRALARLPQEHTVHANTPPVPVPQEPCDYALAAMTLALGVTGTDEQVISILALARRYGVKLNSGRIKELIEAVHLAGDDHTSDRKPSSVKPLRRLGLALKTATLQRHAAARAKEQGALDARAAGQMRLERRLTCEAILFDPLRLLDFRFLRNHAGAFLNRKWFQAVLPKGSSGDIPGI